MGKYLSQKYLSLLILKYFLYLFPALIPITTALVKIFTISSRYEVSNLPECLLASNRSLLVDHRWHTSCHGSPLPWFLPVPLMWSPLSHDVHAVTSPDGNPGSSFCTTRSSQSCFSYVSSLPFSPSGTPFPISSMLI